MSLTVCLDCGRTVLSLRHITTGHRTLIDVETSPRGYVLVNEMAGTYVGLERPGHRKDLHQPHSKTCPVLLTRRTEERTNG